jgi:hypothetical protein
MKFRSLTSDVVGFLESEEYKSAPKDRKFDSLSARLEAIKKRAMNL